MTKQQTPKGARPWTHRADNRKRLVDAGHEVLSEKGLGAVTVKEIAQVAGVSPGLFHYYFASKDELLLAVVEESGRRFKEGLERGVGARWPAKDRIEGAVGFIEEVAKREPQLLRLRYELYALGLRDPEFLPAVGEQLANVKANMARILGRWFTGTEEDRIRALAAVILACFGGLALQHIARPDVDLAPAYGLLRELMETFLTPDDATQKQTP